MVRRIVAVLIALSVAVMPATAGTMPAAMSSANSISHDLMSHLGMSADMPEDCHHQHAAPGKDGTKTMDDGAAMAACCANCFTYVATAVPGITLGPTVSSLQPIMAAGVVVSTIGTPPFRPPRV